MKRYKIHNDSDVCCGDGGTAKCDGLDWFLYQTTKPAIC